MMWNFTNQAELINLKPKDGNLSQDQENEQSE
jgi:hypothetical protein